MKIKPNEIKKMFIAFLNEKVPNSWRTYINNIDSHVNVWAKEHSLVKESIYEKYLPKDVDKLIIDLKSKDIWLQRNNNAYSTPLSWYKKFCKQLNEKSNILKSNKKKLGEQRKKEIKNIEEQEELEQFYKTEKTKKEIRNELMKLVESEPIEIIVNSRKYKRDNNTIAQIKFLRDSKCQICKKFILKKDGSRYIEGAHIVEKHRKGNESPNNIILLCPNHHKEFDLGEKEIKEHTKSKVVFVLNKKKYSINLEI